MKLDPEQLEAEAKAHRQRLASSLWTEVDSTQKAATISVGDAQDATTAPSLATGIAPTHEGPTKPRSRRKAQGQLPIDSPDLAPQPSLSEIWMSLQHLTGIVSALQKNQSANVANYPSWLLDAAGIPLTYDAPDPSRKNVCVRVLPTTYNEIKQVQQRLGLRTIAGAWELLIRLGLAAASRLPDQSLQRTHPLRSGLPAIKLKLPRGSG